MFWAIARGRERGQESQPAGAVEYLPQSAKMRSSDQREVFILSMPSMVSPSKFGYSSRCVYDMYSLDNFMHLPQDFGCSSRVR